MSFSSLSPDFRESLRQMADKLAEKEAAEQAKKEASAPQKVAIKIAMGETTKDVEFNGGWLAGKWSGEGENLQVLYNGQWQRVGDLPVGVEVQILTEQSTDQANDVYEVGTVVEIPKEGASPKIDNKSVGGSK